MKSIKKLLFFSTFSFSIFETITQRMKIENKRKEKHFHFWLVKSFICTNKMENKRKEKNKDSVSNGNSWINWYFLNMNTLNTLTTCNFLRQIKQIDERTPSVFALLDSMRVAIAWSYKFRVRITSCVIFRSETNEKDNCFIIYFFVWFCLYDSARKHNINERCCDDSVFILQQHQVAQSDVCLAFKSVNGTKWYCVSCVCEDALFM